MKTTIELPDTIFRFAKMTAARRGITLKRFFTDAVELHLGRHVARTGSPSTSTAGPAPPWMAGLGGLADLGDEHRAVLEAIEEEFEKLDPADVP